MQTHIETRMLQGAVALASVVPILAGMQGIVESAAMVRGVGPPLAPDLDSHFRYLSGLLLGIGLGFLACVPRIADRGAAFRLLGGIVLVGGLARLLGVVLYGLPGPEHRFALVMELGVVPALMLWQARVARIS